MAFIVNGQRIYGQSYAILSRAPGLFPVPPPVFVTLTFPGRFYQRTFLYVWSWLNGLAPPPHRHFSLAEKMAIYRYVASLRAPLNCSIIVCWLHLIAAEGAILPIINNEVLDAYRCIPRGVDRSVEIVRKYHLLGLLYHQNIVVDDGQDSAFRVMMRASYPDACANTNADVVAITKTAPLYVTLFLQPSPGRTFFIGRARSPVGGYPLVMRQRSSRVTGWVLFGHEDVDVACPAFLHVWLYLSGLEPNMKGVSGATLVKMWTYIDYFGLDGQISAFMDDYLYHLATSLDLPIATIRAIIKLVPATTWASMYVAIFSPSLKDGRS